MRQNKLTLNRDKTEILVFSEKDQPPPEEFHYNGNIIKAKVSCPYLGLMFGNKLKSDLELNKILIKMATANR